MTTLVTGGAGFIGSHVAQRLLAQGERVVILDNFNDYYDPAIKRLNIQRLGQHPNLVVMEGDIRDEQLVPQIFAQHGITRVGHLAAMAGVRFSVSETPLYVAVNLVGSMNLFEAAVAHGVKHFVLASTSSVYGKTPLLPFVETDTADRPLAAYPASKRAAEMLGHTYHHLHSMNVTALRFFNVYGPAGRPDMMPMQLMEASVDGRVMKLFNGGDIHRDWTFIEDTVTGVINALDRPMGYEIINLGVGNPISLMEMVEAIEEFSGRRIHWEPVETPLSDPPITFCNNEKARRLLDFNPQVSVHEGLKMTWDWFREWKQL